LAKEVIMPKFGFTQEESEILEWLKKEGERVEKGDPIAVVSTDKISMEVEAPATGLLAGIKYPIGTMVPVTEIIAYIVQPGEEIPSDAKTATKTHAVPQTQNNQQPSSLKISPVAEKLLQENHLNANDISGSGPGGLITRTDVEKYLEKSKLFPGRVKATPAAKRIGKERNIDLSDIKGSGPGGRIQAQDIVSEKTSLLEGNTSAGELTVLKEIPMVGMRRTIAENMSRSMREAPHMTLQIDVVMDAVEDQRKAINAKKMNESERISATAVIVKAVALAIQKNPIINSHYTAEKILIFNEINIGVATALEEGLIVPVIHSADHKTISHISAELNDLALQARESRLKPENMLNGTFTISNLGMMGIDRFTAIINPPQSAILAVGAIKRQIVSDDDKMGLRTKRVATMTLSADHRVMDGAQAAHFLMDIRNMLENSEEIFR
jgi:pyruvate dehydrogenase E2 component (dihydrolipoamide acetyltransferase)